MKRITLILKTSEVLPVRKAASVAGANHIVVHTMPHREYALVPIQHVSAEDDLVKLDVMVVDSHFDEVVSTILTTAHFGKIEKISSINAKHALLSFSKLAA